jgi:hypothetical protein
MFAVCAAVLTGRRVSDDRPNAVRTTMSTRRAARAAIAIAAAIVAAGAGAACRARQAPVVVAVTFVNSWRMAGDALSGDEQAIVRRATLETLRAAYDRFGVRFEEAASAARIIRVEDTPYSRPFFGAAGMTYAVTRVSSVRFDVLVNAELAAAGCASPAQCAKSRRDLLEGLGRGVGATAAHELGHQAGFGFALDSPCEDCYDGRASTSYAHFFGRKHWSARALSLMREQLPPALH